MTTKKLECSTEGFCSLLPEIETTAEMEASPELAGIAEALAKIAKGAEDSAKDPSKTEPY